jgi:tetratricopeptide (TPR) repeat protein
MTQRAWAAARLQEPDAEVWARRALGIQRDKLPEGHGEQAVGLTWLGFVLLQQGELAEARPLLERALEIRRATAPTQDWRTHAAAGFLGEVLLRQGETERGLALLRQAVDALTAQFGAANVRTQEARRRLERWTAPGIRSWAGKP